METAFIAEFAHAIELYRRVLERFIKTKDINPTYLTLSRKHWSPPSIYTLVFVNFPMSPRILSVWRIRVLDRLGFLYQRFEVCAGLCRERYNWASQNVNGEQYERCIYNGKWNASYPSSASFSSR